MRFSTVSPAIASLVFLWLTQPVAAQAGIGNRDIVPQCGPQIRFTASYLAEAKPGQGAGFLFRIENNSSRPITLAEPVPSSAHWYAHVGNLWMWRASAGRGGSLVNAENPRGPMFAARLDPAATSPQMLEIPPHGSREWTEWVSEDPAIAYRPSCAQCNYPGEHEFQAVFAYAWLPLPHQVIPHLLTCGLRSAPVVMPPNDNPARLRPR
jgi:hypothetical protein